MNPIKMEIQRTYRFNREWKLNSDAIFNSEVAVRVYDEMCQAGVIPPPEKDFVFVSTSSNIPTHEMVFFEEDQKRRTGASSFLVGDIAAVPKAPHYRQRTANNGAFQFFKWDAQHLPIADGVAHVIWDRKGWLWHAAKSLNSEEFLEALDHYHKVLAPDGSIVIDHSPEYRNSQIRISRRERMRRKKIRAELRVEVQGGPKAGWYYDHDDSNEQGPQELEPSTVEMIRRYQVEANPALEAKVREKFTPLVIGSGIGRLNVLRKR